MLGINEFIIFVVTSHSAKQFALYSFVWEGRQRGQGVARERWSRYEQDVEASGYI